MDSVRDVLLKQAGPFLAENHSQRRKVNLYKPMVYSKVDYFYMAYCFGQSKQWEKAIEAYKKALAMDPGFEAAKKNLGTAFLKNKQLKWNFKIVKLYLLQ